MSALVLDAGALVAVDRGDRAMIARLRVAQASGIEVRTTGVIIAHVWRHGGRQASLARLLKAVDVDEALGRAAGELLGPAGSSDAADATVAVVAATGDRVLTADPGDLSRLVAASGRAALVVGC